MLLLVLRQPLLHFAVLGALIFFVHGFFNDVEPQTDRPKIVVSQQDAEWLANQFRATWRRAPLQAELDALVEDFVREEIYVRTALSLGLDQGDTVVRRRLRQKMEFLTEAGAEAASPSDEELETHLAANVEKFSIAPRLAFSQVMISPDQPQDGKDILVALQNGVDHTEIGVRSLLPHSVRLSAIQAVDGTFGEGFFAQLAALEPREWAGPVRSGYGEHIVRMDVFEPGRLPTLEETREQVELDWRAQKARELRRVRFDELYSTYDVSLPDAQRIVEQ